MFVMDPLNTIKMLSTYRKYPTVWFCTGMSNIADLSMCCRKTSEKMEVVGDPNASFFLNNERVQKLNIVVVLRFWILWLSRV